jgi:PadR family transcriptional regulator, regulatory protein PadR
MQRRTTSTSTVLAVLVDAAGEGVYGYDVMKSTGLGSGTLYPILGRLTDEGWLRTEVVDSEIAGRPPRRLYFLTAIGNREARNYLTPSPVFGRAHLA